MSDIAARLTAMAPEERLYALRTLPAHLAGAAQTERLRHILTSRGFMQAKVDAVGVEPLIADYSLATDDAEDLRLLQSAIRLAAHVLTEDASQLYGQLAARLEGLDAPAIRAVLDGEPQRPWLRPRTRSLVLAGAPLVRTLVGHTDYVHEILVLADGATVVSVADDGTIIVWDVNAGVEVRRLGDSSPRRTSSAGVTTAAILPDGVRLLVGRRNGALELWDVTTGAAMGELPAEHRDVGAVAAFDDGCRVLTASMSGALHVYDLRSGAALQTGTTSYGTLSPATIVPRDRVVYGAGSRVAMWDPQTGENAEIVLFEDCYVTSLTTLASGDVLMTTRDGSVRVLDPQSGRVVRRIRASFDAAVASAKPLADDRILSATWDGHLTVWDAASDTRLVSIDTGAGIRSLAVLPDGRRAITGGPDGALRVWDLAAGGSTQRASVPREHEQSVYFVGMPDARRVVSLAHDGALRVWSVDDGRELLTFQLYDGTSSPGGWSVALAAGRVIAASPTGEIAAVTLGFEGAFERWQAHDVGASAICALPDGKRALSSGVSGDIRLWNVRSGAELFSFDITKWGLRRGLHIRALRALGDGKHALAIFMERPVHVFEVASGTLLRTLPAELSFRASLPDVDAVLTLRGGQWIVIDPLSGSTLRSIAGPTEPVAQVAVAGKGRFAVTLFRNGLLNHWRTEDGEVLCGFGADAPLSACAIADDGQLVVASDRSGRLHFLALERHARSHTTSSADDERRWWRFWSRRH